MCDVDTENLSDRNYDILSWLKKNVFIKDIKENFLVVYIIERDYDWIQIISLMTLRCMLIWFLLFDFLEEWHS